MVANPQHPTPPMNTQATFKSTHPSHSEWLSLPPLRLSTFKDSHPSHSSRVSLPPLWAAILVGVTLAISFPSELHAAAISAGATGNWSDTGTWSGGVVPASGDTVTIGSGYTVSLPSGSAASANMTIDSGGNLEITGGSLTLDAGNNIGGGGNFTLSAGSFTNSNIQYATTGSVNFNITGGTYTYTSNSDIRMGWGNFTMSGGTISIGSGSNRFIGGLNSTTQASNLVVDGSGASISWKRILLNASGRNANFTFNLDATGVSEISTTGSSTLTYSNLAVDGSSYTGGSASFNLITGVTAGIGGPLLPVDSAAGIRPPLIWWQGHMC